MRVVRSRGAWVIGATVVALAASLAASLLLAPRRAPGERLEDLAVGLVAVAAVVALVTITSRLKQQSRSTAAIAIAAQRVGLAVDANEVAGAVLEAAREVFPAADFGGILLFDHEREKLMPMPVAMVGGQVRRGDPTTFGMNPGEGVAGKVFLTCEPRRWGTARELVAEHASMQAATKDVIRAVTGGVRSAAGAPLRLPDRGVIGVITLGCTSRDHLFGARDMVVLQGLAEQAAMGVERARMYEEQRAQAMTDPLTGLANYRQLKNVLTQEVARARRNQGTVAVIFSDLDDFKLVNDRHGHRVGDLVLKLLARAMVDELRTEDLAARYGGDEFVCVLPGADLIQGRQVMERIGSRFRDLLAADPLLQAIETRPSSGCAVYPDHGSTAEDVLAAADAALMGLKNRVPGEELERA